MKRRSRRIEVLSRVACRLLCVYLLFIKKKKTPCASLTLQQAAVPVELPFRSFASSELSRRLVVSQTITEEKEEYRPSSTRNRKRGRKETEHLPVRKVYNPSLASLPPQAISSSSSTNFVFFPFVKTRRKRRETAQPHLCAF